LSDEGLAIVVKEPVELVLFEVAVVCVEDVDGWTGACVELSVGGSLQILVRCLRLHLQHRFFEPQLDTLWCPKQLKHSFSLLMMSKRLWWSLTASHVPGA